MTNENIFGLILVLAVVFGVAALLKILCTSLSCRFTPHTHPVSSGKKDEETYNVGIFNYDAQFVTKPSSEKYDVLIKSAEESNGFYAA